MFLKIQSGIVCASGTKVIGGKSKTGKFTPNIKCKTKKHWDGVYKWVHVGPTGKYSPLKLNSSGFLDQKCEYDSFERSTSKIIQIIATRSPNELQE